MSGNAKRVLGVIVVLLVASGAAYLYDRLQIIRDGQRTSVCTGRMKVIAVSLQQYQQSNEYALPPAYVIGPDGRRWHSWRVLILPYISEHSLYSEYRFDEPWDGPNNSKLARRMPKTYGCPGDPQAAERGETNYFAIVGPGTAFPDNGRRFPFGWSNGTGLLPNHDLVLLVKQDGRPLLQSPGNMWLNRFPRASETFLVVESTGRGINWMEPRDLELNDMSFSLNNPNAPSMSSRHRGASIMAAMADGSVMRINVKDSETLRRMCLVDPDKKAAPNE